jgi:hypothetical protein
MNYKDKFVGIKIYGFCNGYFGRDSYDDKLIIASGEDWIVAKNESGVNEFASFESVDEMQTLIEKWSVEEDF